MVAIQFEWINSDHDCQRYGADKRRAIRVQAMKSVAASRKKTGTWGKQNTRQTEIVICDNDSSNSNSESPCNSGKGRELHRSSIRARDALKTKAHAIPIVRYLKSDGIPATAGPGASALTQLGQWNARPPRGMPLFGFEHLSADVGVNVLDLDELTGVATGQVAASMLSEHRTSLDKLIVRRRQSYLFHIPARYGHSACLDDAIRCVASKAKRVLLPNNPASAGGELDLFGLYGKALRSLQAAVDDSNDWTDPSILAAIEILSICELLDSPSRPCAWENHISGAARIIRARGPSRWKTEFEKALLTSMLSPIICEAIRLFEPCFLDEEPWKEVIRSLVIDGGNHYSPRGQGYMQLWSLGIELPGLLIDVYRATAGSESLTQKQIDNLEARCRKHKEEIVEWSRNYDKHQSTTPSDETPLDVRIELYGAGLSMLISASRFIGAISPKERVAMEAEAVKYSTMYLDVLCEVNEKNKWASFYLQQKVVVATSVLASTDAWLEGEGLNKEAPNQRLIEGWKFQAWCDSMLGEGMQFDPEEGYHDHSRAWKTLYKYPIQSVNSGWNARTATFGTAVTAGN
ncbi:hypothetical protein BKA67DRAFT_660424 [Truncatella angustata]|uniref:Uncharacterized protein n=1 Tax=Truncatella angustata TaxID=152316 RepID=A0A9P8ZU86_9PEZI|nr:uncharacterized protein BKA67DRAFT_660424 [Truncatella angustata]KAH6651629.1 hypothetical protein BKA67DRAFT_660424 [Truncatella angustata]